MVRHSAAPKRRHSRTHRTARSTPSESTGKDIPPELATDLSETELDLLRHLQKGYEIQTDTLGGDVLLRRARGEEPIRPLSATRNTVKALEERGLVAQTESHDPLRVDWRLSAPQSAKKSARTRKRLRRKT
jgi:hypothetical protein